MKKSNIIILVIIVVIILAGVSFYNNLVKADQAVQTGWAQVETAYQRRFDLIPNLVASVKGIMTQEQEVFGKLAEARMKYAGATTITDKAAAANQVETSLARLLAVVENYPQLKSADTVQTLMAQLEGTENRINVERGRYNELVQAFNVKVKTFPANLFAGLFGFTPKTFFEAQTGAQTVPTVNLQPNQ